MIRKDDIKRGWLVLILALILALSASIAVWAADYKTISSVTIRVSSKLEPGYYLPGIDYGEDEGTATDGAITVSVSNDRYYISDCRWTTSTSKIMTAGATPEMRVYLTPYDIDDYRFRGTYNSDNVTVHGASYVSASKSGNNLIVRIKVNPIKGSFDPPDNVGWRSGSKGTARWSGADDNDSGRYEVELRRGGTKVTTVQTTSTSYNLYPYMTVAGWYSFRVRTIPKTTNQENYADNSEWIESDEIYIDEDEVAEDTGIAYIDTDMAEVQGLAGWIYDEGYWYYRYPNGRFLTDGWLGLGDKWYLFDSDGHMCIGWRYWDDQYYYFGYDGAMVTGWLTLDDGTYYLNPTKDPFEGCMLHSGVFQIDGETYGFDDSGRRVSGWQQVGDDTWSYFYPETGIMARNTVIDTFRVGDDGAWIQ